MNTPFDPTHTPSSVDEWMALIDYQIEQEALDKALTNVNKAIELYPTDFRCWNRKALILAKQQNIEASLEANHQALSLNPENAVSLFNIGNCYNALDDISKALHYYELYTEFAPEDYSGWLNLGSMYASELEISKARKCYEKALSINPQGEDALYNLNLIATQQNRLKKANQYLDQLLESNPNSAIAWQGKGFLFTDQGKWQQAIQAFEKALQIDDQLEEAWNGLGNVYAQMGNVVQAVDCFDKAIVIEPTWALPYNDKGFVMMTNGHFEKAKTLFEKAIDLGEKEIAGVNLGHVLLLTGETRKALDIYIACRHFYDTEQAFKQDLIQDRSLLIDLGLKRKDIDEVWKQIR